MQAELAKMIGPVSLSANITRVPGLGRDVLKVRVGSSDQKKGASGGFRLLLARVTLEGAWQPIAIYPKAHQADMPRKDILRALEEASEGEAPSAEPEAQPEPPAADGESKPEW